MEQKPLLRLLELQEYQNIDLVNGFLRAEYCRLFDFREVIESHLDLIEDLLHYKKWEDTATSERVNEHDPLLEKHHADEGQHRETGIEDDGMMSW